MFEINLSKDRLQATILWNRDIVDNVGDIGEEAILKALKKLNITQGIKDQVIEEFLRSPDKFETSKVVAEGIKPVPPAPARLMWRPDLINYKDPELKNSPPEFFALTPDHLIVYPGDMVLLVAPAQEGKTGRTVDGRPIAAPARVDAALKAKGTKIDPMNHIYYALHYGQIEYTDNQLNITSGCRIPEDKMSCNIDIYPNKDRVAYQKKITTFFTDMKIIDSLDLSAIQDNIAKACTTGQIIQNISVAKGILPEDGVDGRIVWFPDKGNYDYWDNVPAELRTVCPGDIIAQLIEAVPGKKGYRINGEALTNKPGKPYTLKTDHTTVNANDQLMAKEFGNLEYSSGFLSIKPFLIASPDKLHIIVAPYAVLPTNYATPKETILNYLKKKFKANIDENMLIEYLSGKKNIKQQKEPIYIGKGILPQDGQDESIKFLIEIPANSGDKQILVHESLAIAEIIKGQEAIDGHNVNGDTIKAKPGYKIPWTFSDDFEFKNNQLCCKSFGLLRTAKHAISIEKFWHIDSRDMQLWLSVYPIPWEQIPVYKDQIKKMIEAEGIKAEIDIKLLDAHINETRLLEAPRSILMAQGQLPGEPENGKIIFRKPLYQGNLEEDLQKNELNKYEWQIVQPGEAVLQIGKAKKGEDGFNLHGKKISGKPGEEVFITYSTDFEFDKGNNLLCRDYGIAYQNHRKDIRLYKLLNISDDNMSATFVFVPEGAINIQELLNKKGIKAGIKPDLAAYWLETRAANRPLEKEVAVGTMPITGKDGHIEFNLDLKKLEASSGKLKEDGSVDFVEMLHFQQTLKGEILATLTPPIAGQNGTDVLGNILPFEAGKTPQLRPGKNIILSADGQSISSAIDGTVIFNENTLSVDNLKHIEGDIDNKAGKIHHPTSVHIKGNILTGGELSSDGDIIIDGCVDGGTVIARGNVGIRHGILPKSTVKAGGDIQASFVQEATITAGFDLDFYEYLQDAQCHVLGKVKAKIPGTGGAIRGGIIFAAAGLEINSIGSDNNLKTSITCGVHPDSAELYKQISAITDTISQYQTTIAAYKDGNSYKFDGLDPKLKKIAQKVINSIKKMDSAIIELRQKIQVMNKPYQNASIMIRQQVYPGTIMIIGNARTTITTTTVHAAFYEKKKTGTISWYPLF